MIIGIVGSEAKKFTPETEHAAKQLIRKLIADPNVTGVTSGHCHLGGIDIWAEEIAKELRLDLYIYPPKNLNWSTGYKPRNIQIAKTCNELHNITVKHLPPNYQGMKFDSCYHCSTTAHQKSGGCWTAKYAQKIGKPAYWHVI